MWTNAYLGGVRGGEDGWFWRQRDHVEKWGADFSWDPGVLATLTGRVQNIHLPNTITAATTGASLLSSYPHTPPFLAPRYPP